VLGFDPSLTGATSCEAILVGSIFSLSIPPELPNLTDNQDQTYPLLILDKLGNIYDIYTIIYVKSKHEFPICDFQEGR
jgi:hypothetical protein